MTSLSLLGKQLSLESCLSSLEGKDDADASFLLCCQFSRFATGALLLLIGICYFQNVEDDSPFVPPSFSFSRSPPLCH